MAMKNKQLKSVQLWAIIDLQKEVPRFCYGDEKKTNGAMALYDKKPKIEEHWKPFKKVIKVLVTENISNNA